MLSLLLALVLIWPTSAQHWAVASTYGVGDGFLGGRMACGGRLTLHQAVVAHRTLRCGTKVTFWFHGRKVHAVVRDRGPYVRGRSWDFGPMVARTLHFRGVGWVRWSLGYR